MSTLNNEIQDRVEAFVRDLERLIRKQALEAVADALGASAAAGVSRSSAGRAAKPGKAAKAAAPADPFGPRKRRSADEIDSLAGTILEFVEKNPGLRSEKIKSALRIPASDWMLPVKKLIDEGKLTTKGEKRATEYFAKKK